MAIGWRLWIVWGRDWRVLVIPGLAFLGNVAGGLTLLIFDGLAVTHGLSSEFTANLPYPQLTQSLLSTMLIYTWLVTGLIVFKLFKVNKQMVVMSNGRAGSDYSKIIVALVESGALMSLTLVAYFVASNVGNVCNGTTGVANPTEHSFVETRCNHLRKQRTSGPWPGPDSDLLRECVFDETPTCHLQPLAATLSWIPATM